MQGAESGVRCPAKGNLAYNAIKDWLHRPPRLSRALRVNGGATPLAVSTQKSKFGLASTWGVLSVLAILANAVKRLAPIAMQPFKTHDFSTFHWSLYGGFALLMAYAEGYKGFQQKFSPMVVQRALTLDESSGPLRLLFAGPYSMGLFHASSKRKKVSWILTLSVLALVQVVKRLAYPWRSIVDAGVVVGLSWGGLAIACIWVRSWFGQAPGVDAQLPDAQPVEKAIS